MRRWWKRKGMGVELLSGNFWETARVDWGVEILGAQGQNLRALG